MKKIEQFIQQNYLGNLSSIEFLRDAMAYFNSRTEERNAEKSFNELFMEYLKIRGEFKVNG